MKKIKTLGILNTFVFKLKEQAEEDNEKAHELAAEGNMLEGEAYYLEAAIMHKIAVLLSESIKEESWDETLHS